MCRSTAVAIVTLSSPPAHIHDGSRQESVAPRPSGAAEAGAGAHAQPPGGPRAVAGCRVPSSCEDGLRCSVAPMLVGSNAHGFQIMESSSPDTPTVACPAAARTAALNDVFGLVAT